MTTELQEKIKKLERENSNLLKLQELTSDLVSTTDLDHLLHKITEAARLIAGSESATIFLIDKDTKELYFKVALGEKGNQVSHFRLPLNEKSIAGWVAVHQEPTMVNDTSKDERHFKRIDRDVGYETHSILAVPVIFRDEILGVLEAINKQDGEYTPDDMKYLNLLATEAAIAIKNTQLIEDLRNFFVNGIELLIDAMENQSALERGHAFRVARLATSLARLAGVTGKEYENIYYAALLHDIGRIHPLPETDDVRKHCIIGAEILSRIHLLRDIVPYIRHQYERYDGSGYPDHFRGENIPLGARILGLAEAYQEECEGSPDLETVRNFTESHQGEFDPHILELLPQALGITV